MRLFVEIGYQAATNARIAEAVGLTRGAMLYHFPDRDQAWSRLSFTSRPRASSCCMATAVDQAQPGVMRPYRSRDRVLLGLAAPSRRSSPSRSCNTRRAHRRRPE